MLGGFDAYAIYINYYGGGIPYINDVSAYDADLKRQAETLREYFSYMENSGDTVFVEASRYKELSSRV